MTVVFLIWQGLWGLSKRVFLESPFLLCALKVFRCFKIRSGKLTRSSLKGVSNRALFAYKNGRFASRFLLLGIGFLEALKKTNLSFKSPSPKPHLNRTGSGFALPIRANFTEIAKPRTLPQKPLSRPPKLAPADLS